MAKRSSSRGGRSGGFLRAVVEWVSGPPTKRRRVLVRDFAISSEVLEYIRGSGCTVEDRVSLGRLLLKLDANPLDSQALLGPRPGSPYPRGLRWAPFGRHKLVFQFDPAHDRVRLLVCEGPGE